MGIITGPGTRIDRRINTGIITGPGTRINTRINTRVVTGLGIDIKVCTLHCFISSHCVLFKTCTKRLIRELN